MSRRTTIFVGILLAVLAVAGNRWLLQRQIRVIVDDELHRLGVKP